MQEHAHSRGTARELGYAAVPAAADRLPELRHALLHWSQRLALTPDRAEQLILATYEALANAVQHAYRDGVGTLDLYAVHRPWSGVVEVRVADRGNWLPPSADPGPLHGRGLPLMRELADSVEVHPQQDGTTVVLRWNT